jgi:putative endonuclease
MDNQTGTTSERGLRGEGHAESYLQRQGLATLARNYRCRQGEIDLVMRDGEVLVFVEVRYRDSTQFGQPLETIGSRKRARLIAAASVYLQREAAYADLACRFDAVGLTGPLRQPEVEWVKDAFRDA